MKDRKKKNLIIGGLGCLVVLMGLAYAILSQTLTINGTAKTSGKWDIYIESIVATDEGYTGISDNAFVDDNDKTKASFVASLKKPKDYVEYTVTVKNNGNIDAILKELVLTKENNNENIKITDTAPIDKVLIAGATEQFTIKVEFLETATTVDNTVEVSYLIELNYQQYDGNANQGAGEPALPSTVVMVGLNEDDTVNLSVDKYAFSEAVDGIELYTSATYDGEYNLIATIGDGLSVNAEKSAFNEFYKIKSYVIENGEKSYTDYSDLVELKAYPTTVEKSFVGCTLEYCQYSIYNTNSIAYDGLALYYSTNGFSYDVATSPGEGTEVYTNSTYYPPSGQTYYYKIYGYLNLNGVIISSDLSEAVTITNEN